MATDRDELAAAADTFLAETDACLGSGDWAHYVSRYTSDVVYVEHVVGTMHGREPVREWIEQTMTTFPGSHMSDLPARWVTLDPENDRVVIDLDNVMRDPGDGSRFSASNITILTYAGGGLWSRQEDVYNPHWFLDMATTWLRHSHRLGTLDDAARLWAEQMAVALE